MHSLAVEEASGLAASASASANSSGVLYTHNDSGDIPRAFAVTTRGEILGRKREKTRRRLHCHEHLRLVGSGASSLLSSSSCLNFSTICRGKKSFLDPLDRTNFCNNDRSVKFQGTPLTWSMQQVASFLVGKQTLDLCWEQPNRGNDWVDQMV